jgi:hypothetical protein
MDTVAINVQQLFFLVTASAHVWQLLFIRTTANHIQLLFSGTGTVTVQQLFSYIGRRAAVHVPRLLWLETVAVNVISCFSYRPAVVLEDSSRSRAVVDPADSSSCAAAVVHRVLSGVVTMQQLLFLS